MKQNIVEAMRLSEIGTDINDREKVHESKYAALLQKYKQLQVSYKAKFTANQQFEQFVREQHESQEKFLKKMNLRSTSTTQKSEKINAKQSKKNN